MHNATLLQQMTMAQLIAGLPPELKTAYELSLETNSNATDIAGT
jgi:hypothetical protein